MNTRTKCTSTLHSLKPTQCANEGEWRVVTIFVLQEPSFALPARDCASGQHAEQHMKACDFEGRRRSQTTCAPPEAGAPCPAARTHTGTIYK